MRRILQMGLLLLGVSGCVDSGPAREVAQTTPENQEEYITRTDAQYEIAQFYSWLRNSGQLMYGMPHPVPGMKPRELDPDTLTPIPPAPKDPVVEFERLMEDEDFRGAWKNGGRRL